MGEGERDKRIPRRGDYQSSASFPFPLLFLFLEQLAHQLQAIALVFGKAAEGLHAHRPPIPSRFNIRRCPKKSLPGVDITFGLYYDGCNRIFTGRTTHKENGGHDDELAITDVADSYQWLLDKGADIIFSDNPMLLNKYLKTINKRNLKQ